jgi:orotate phosphoribosyltransferase
MSSRFNQSAFIEFIIENRVVGFFDAPVTLKSGRQSNWYVNWRTVSGDVYLIDRLADFLIDFAVEKGLEPDAFFGVPEGATKLGLLATYKWATSRDDFAKGRYALPMGRGKPKEHGAPQDKFFLTPPSGKIVVVEDVTTTGGSLIGALDQLSALDVEVIAAVGLTNRMEFRDDGLSVKDAIAKRGVRYLALSEAADFLPEAYRSLQPGDAIGRAIEAEFMEYGVQPLTILSKKRSDT